MKTFYVIQVKYEFYWTKLDYGVYDSIEDAHKFMKTHYPNVSEYKIEKVITKIVYDSEELIN